MSDILSPEFAEFGAEAAFSVGTDDGVDVVTTLGGETRFFVAQTDEFEVRRADRSEDPELRLRTRDAATAERYLTAELGDGLRSRLGFGLFLFLRSVGDPTPADGFELSPTPDGVVVLDSRSAAVIGVFSSREDAILYTFYADAPLDLMRQSYRHPDGDPLFHDVRQLQHNRAVPLPPESRGEQHD
jgi:hypothetical protein